eukprot:174016-Rhodomonas_salina.1
MVLRGDGAAQDDAVAQAARCASRHAACVRGHRSVYHASSPRSTHRALDGLPRRRGSAGGSHGGLFGQADPGLS